MSWNDALDLMVKVAPALSIVAGIAIALRQIESGRRAAAITVAKNYQIEINKLMFQNVELIAAGVTPERLQTLKQDLTRYLQYRWLFSIVCFSCQESYVSLAADEVMRSRLKVTISLFRYFILSGTELTPAQQRGFRPEFWAFLQEAAAGPEHPQSAIVRNWGAREAKGAEG